MNRIVELTWEPRTTREGGARETDKMSSLSARKAYLLAQERACRILKD